MLHVGSNVARMVANCSVMKYIRNILFERVSIRDEILTPDELLHILKDILLNTIVNERGVPYLN